MGKVADLLGLAVANTEAKVAVVRCNGSCEHRPRIAEYDGLQTCAAMNSCGAGETGCGFGCLGCGDCVAGFLRLMRRSVRVVVRAPRLVHVTSSSFERRVLRVAVFTCSA